MGKRGVRIRDVAEMAGVSTATVSRALSHPDRVTPHTRAAVATAIAATGYRPNEAARNLRAGRTGGIVALVPDLANPFFAQILSGIAGVLSPAGYNLLIADTRTSDPARLADYADPSRADGLITLDGSLPAAMIDGAVPVVQACEWVPGARAPQVRIDNARATALAVGHLTGLGHRRLGYVGGPSGNVLNDTRLAGFYAALRAAGLPPQEAPVYPGDFSLQSGRIAAGIWFDQGAERPGAVCLASDAMACGFIAEVTRRGLRVPQDVSVVGFDDIELTSHLAPPLTTIRQPRLEIGRQAAGLLLDRIAGRRDLADRVLEVELITRASTSSPA